ncbi:hypothetical protein evm_003717 [Chilo suppressalis]|nr:hypothetical protein evm_003717 [Chilo suppressalis]
MRHSARYSAVPSKSRFAHNRLACAQSRPKSRRAFMGRAQTKGTSKKSSPFKPRKIEGSFVRSCTEPSVREYDSHLADIFLCPTGSSAVSADLEVLTRNVCDLTHHVCNQLYAALMQAENNAQQQANELAASSNTTREQLTSTTENILSEVVKCNKEALLEVYNRFETYMGHTLRKRRVYIPAGHSSMITYAAGIWGTATKFHSVRRALRSFQRGFAIRAIRGFHTISAVAAEALAQFPPLHLVVEEAHAIYTAKKTGLSPDLPDDIRMHRRVKVKDLLHPAQRITINFEEVSTQEETDELLHPDAPSIFTDGRKQDTGETGASYIIMLPNHTHIVRKFKLCRTARVFFTELFAIDRALKWALEGNHAEVSVFTDSLSALKAIQDRSNTDPLVNSIHHSLYRLQEKETNIRFTWIKAHVGIEGNELADAAAKEAAAKKTAALMNVFPLSHTKRYLKERTLSAWQEDYETAPQGAVTKSFFQTIAEITEFRTIVKPSFSVTQILSGHGYHKAYLHKYKITPDDCCPCDNHTKQDITHILKDCPIFHCTRAEYENYCGLYKIEPYNLLETIKSETATCKFIKHVDTIVSQLKRINGT